MTELTEREARLARMIKKSDIYTSLWADSNFQIWKKNVVDARLDKLREDILKGDTLTEEGRRTLERNVFAQKFISDMFETFFNEMQRANEEARKTQRELSSTNTVG